MSANEKDIKSYVDYLVCLYYQTGRKYYCVRPCINRLLIIFKLCCDKNNIKTFSDNIYINSGCVGIPRIFDIIERDVYFPPCPAQQNFEITEVLDKNAFIPEKFSYALEDFSISVAEKKLLEDIFRLFGNYDISFLAKNQNEIIKQMPTIDLSGDKMINKFEVYNFFTDSNELYEKYQSNKIFKFIENSDYIKLYCDKIEKNEDIFSKLMTRIRNLDTNKQKKLLQYLEANKDNNDNFLEFKETNLHKSLIK